MLRRHFIICIILTKLVNVTMITEMLFVVVYRIKVVHDAENGWYPCCWIINVLATFHGLLFAYQYVLYIAEVEN